MPAFAPSHTTRQPASRMRSATASAGKMCPPAPPAMIMMVLDMSPRRSFGASPHHLPRLPIDPQQDGERDAVGDQAAAAEAHQGKGQSLGREKNPKYAHTCLCVCTARPPHTPP